MQIRVIVAAAYTNFSVPASQTLLLRGIAWAGKRPADLLARSTH